MIRTIAIGIVGGIIAGITFVIAEMLGARYISDNPFIMPIKAMASVPIGDPPPEIARDTALSVGLGTHAILSILFGLIGAIIVGILRPLRRSALALVVVATLYGTALWLVNFYVLAPALDRPWFTDTPAGQQFVYHTIFFGTVLGIVLAIGAPRPASTAGE